MIIFLTLRVSTLLAELVSLVPFVDGLLRVVVSAAKHTWLCGAESFGGVL